MKNTNFALIALVLLLGACSSTHPNRFSKDGVEEIRLDGDSVDARKITVVHTQTLDHELDMERLKRQTAQKWAKFWEEEYKDTKSELVQLRTMVGLPAERPACPVAGCADGQIRPSSSVTEEMAAKAKGAYGFNSVVQQ